MAQYYENFNGATVGAGHPDFSVIFGSLGISVESTSILQGSNAHLLLSHVSGTFNRNAAAWNVGTTSGETRVRALVEFKNHSASITGSISGAMLSATGNDASRSAYVQWYRFDYGLSKYVSGSDSVVETDEEGSDPFSLAEAGNVVQRYVEIYRNGSLIEVRAWNYNGGTRPATPDISYTDPSPLPVAGAFGLSHLTSGTNDGFQGMRVYEIAVGTDGSEPPTESIDPNAIDIANINTTNELVPGTTATITGTNLTNTTGVTVGGEAQTAVTVVNDTTVTFTVVRGGNPYNQDLTAELTSSDGVASITVQQVPESGTFAVTAANPNTTDDASLWTGLVDTATSNPITIVDGDQAWVKNPNNLTNLAIQPDGTITADQTGTFVVQIWLASEGVWGGDQTVTFTDQEITQVPQGVVTIGTITVGDTTASIPFTYSDTDQTGFEYSLDGGAWTATTSPVSLSDLSASTGYSISVSAVNGIGSGTAATDSFTTDAAATAGPAVSTVNVPTAGSYGIGDTLSFTVNWDVAATVTGTPRLPITLASGTVYATYASGTGTTALVFSYTVQEGDNDADGISLNAIELNGGTIKDASTNNASLTLSGVESTAGVLVDGVRPVITIAGANPYNMTVGETYVEQGATASDNQDGSLGSVTGTGSVDGQTEGQYTITYPGAGVVDSAGNVALDVTRTVNVNAVDAWPFGKRISYAAPKAWTWGGRHPKTGMRVRIFK